MTRLITELLTQAKLPKRKLIAGINKLAAANYRLKPACNALKTLRTH